MAYGMAKDLIKKTSITIEPYIQAVSFNFVIYSVLEIGNLIWKKQLSVLNFRSWKILNPQNKRFKFVDSSAKIQINVVYMWFKYIEIWIALLTFNWNRLIKLSTYSLKQWDFSTKGGMTQHTPSVKSLYL